MEGRIRPGGDLAVQAPTAGHDIVPYRDAFEAFCALSQVYLHMEAWGTSDYAKLPQEEREVFSGLVAAGGLFSYVEDLKREALRKCNRCGVLVKDLWIYPVCAGRVTAGQPLPMVDRELLAVIGSEMYLTSVRLGAMAAEAAEDGATGGVPLYLGDGRFQIGDEIIALMGQGQAVLEALVDLGACDKNTLESRSGYADAVKILRSIKKTYPALGQFITMPGGRNRGGYRTTIQRG